MTILKKIFLLGVIILASVTLTFFGLYWLVPPDNNSIVAASIDKHALLKKKEVGRIILLGGSNLAFSINSQEMSKDLQRPVVNMGLLGGLGVSFNLNEVKPQLQQGDVVVLSFEYENFFFEFNDQGTETQEKLIELEPQFWKYLTWKQKAGIIKTIPSSIQARLETLINRNQGHGKNKVYSREAFDSYGDVIAHLNDTSRKVLSDFVHFHSNMNKRPLREISQFVNYCHQKNIQLIFTFPNYARSAYEQNKLSLSKLNSLLHQELNLPFAGSIEDFVFDDRECYDTVYHLNMQGRQKRTEKLCAFLRSLLS